MKQLLLSVLLLSICACLIPSPARAQEAWKSKDDSLLSRSERIRQSDYKVSIRQGGRWREQKVYGALVSNIVRRQYNETDTAGRERTLMGFCPFTNKFRHSVKVRIQRQGAPFQTVQVRPTEYEIPCRKIDERTVEIELRSPKEKVSVEFDGDRDHNIFVWPDLPDSDQPSKEAKDVLFYGPGEHEAGEIRLQSGQTLYLAEGAVVYGRITAHDAQNIAVRGRGILCGSREIHDFDRRPCLIQLNKCKNVRFEGVIFRDSPAWTMNIGNCDSVLIDNVKHICWMRNSDGIDLCNVRHALIKDCFLRNYDDNISLKNYPQGNAKDANLYDIRMENCTVWADCAHNLLVGPESHSDLYMSDIDFRHIQILEGRETAYPWKGCIAVMVSDEGTFRNISFQDICLDHVRGGQIYSIDFCTYRTMGKECSNVLLKDVRHLGSERLPKGVVHEKVENCRIVNVAEE